METETTKEDVKDMKGWTIPKGTKIYIIKTTKLENPMTKKTDTFRVVKIDNGTGHLDLMPETCLKNC